MAPIEVDAEIYHNGIKERLRRLEIQLKDKFGDQAPTLSVNY
ncbi:MAG: hypothetical protein ACRD5H_16160 [Nitrososphaerales archaeon]